MTSPAHTQTLLPSMRRLLAVAAVLVFLAGVQLFVFPTRTEEYFSWTIASPMTAVFLGAAYWSAVALEVAGAQARTWVNGRIAVPTVFVFTTLTLFATLLHLDLFHFGAQHSVATQAVTWAWMAIYLAVPVLMVVITVRQRRGPGKDPPRTQRLPSWVRLALLALVLIFGIVGLGLFLAPEATATWWPWQLTPLTSRAVGAWLISLAVAAGHSLIENGVARIRPLGATAAVFSVLEGVALIRYGGELDWSSLPAIGYVAVLASLLVLGIWALRAGGAPRGGRSVQGAGGDQNVADKGDVVIGRVEQRPANPAGVDQAE
jgi:hypothetical protein